jgi:hypothetical protein
VFAVPQVPLSLGNTEQAILTVSTSASSCSTFPTTKHNNARFFPGTNFYAKAPGISVQSRIQLLPATVAQAEKDLAAV